VSNVEERVRLSEGGGRAGGPLESAVDATYSIGLRIRMDGTDEEWIVGGAAYKAGITRA